MAPPETSTHNYPIMGLYNTINCNLQNWLICCIRRLGHIRESLSTRTNRNTSAVVNVKQTKWWRCEYAGVNVTRLIKQSSITWSLVRLDTLCKYDTDKQEILTGCRGSTSKGKSSISACLAWTYAKKNFRCSSWSISLSMKLLYLLLTGTVHCIVEIKTQRRIWCWSKCKHHLYLPT